VPVGTVKSRSHRAHKRLAEWLRPLCTVESEPTGGPAPYPEYGDSGVHRNDL
jgi:hypothetical protein